MTYLVNVPSRNVDQVKVTGAELDKLVEARENQDGGAVPASHIGIAGARISDFGITTREHIGQATARWLAQRVVFAQKVGGTMLSAK